MQDSLCGSMGPLSASSRDYVPDKLPASSFSPSDHHQHHVLIINADEEGGLDSSNTIHHSSSKGSNVATTPQSPGSPNLSSWMEMLDELIEAPEPMLFSPVRDNGPATSTLSDSYTEAMSNNSHSFRINHSYSSLSINHIEKQQANMSGGGGSGHPFETYIPNHSPSQFCSQPESLKQQEGKSHLSQFSSHSESLRQQEGKSHLSQFSSHSESLRQQEGKSHLSEFLISGQHQQHAPLMAMPKISPPSPKSPFQRQPSSALHKVFSAPQLSPLDTTRSPKRRSPALLSLPPGIPTNNSEMPLCSSSPHRLHHRTVTSSPQPDHGRFLKSSMNVSENCSPKHYSNSLPISLPSFSYLYQRMHQQRDVPIMLLHQQGTSILRNMSMPKVSAAAANSSKRERLAPLQPRPDMIMVPSSNSSQHQDNGLRMVHLLLACAEAVAREDHFGAKEALYQLKEIVSTNGDSMQRVAAYFTEGLQCRLMGTGRRSYIALRSYDPATADEVLAAYQILYQACPYVKFAHFTSNQAIFEALEDENRVHIVDLDIIQGYQWPAFIQALAARPGGAPHLRITGVGMPLESVQETGKRLGELAESLHVPFEFHAVGERLENLKSYMLQRRVGEALAVNSVFRLHWLLAEPMSPLFGILHMIREQSPNIFTLVEQDASHNGPFFLGRFLEALHYYSAIFDSLDATLPQSSPERTKVEQVVFSNEITNIVACEGTERVERHEKLEKWRKIMEGIGFHNVPLSANAVNQSKLLLGLYPCDGYTLVEDRGTLLLGWQDRAIIGASAWRC